MDTTVEARYGSERERDSPIWSGTFSEHICSFLQATHFCQTYNQIIADMLKARAKAEKVINEIQKRGMVLQDVEARVGALDREYLDMLVEAGIGPDDLCYKQLKRPFVAQPLLC